MKNYKSKISIIIVAVFILNLIPINIVSAKENNNENIISVTNVTKEDAKAWAQNKGATKTFINLADKYWEYYKNHGQVNPAIAYVQSAKETGYGNFGGVLDETYFNPCGMKTSSGGGDHDANAHHRFKNWDEGVQAHLDHLALYAGANGYPRKETSDPRHFASIKGTATTVLSLEGKWASTSGYGESVLKLYRDIEDFSSKRKKPKMNLEDPNEGLNIENNILKIRGWALNGSGVKEVKIYVDNAYVGNAKIGQARPDVNNAFPGYPGGDKSGFTAEFNISKFQSGERFVKAEVVGKDGSVDSQSAKVNLKKKPSKMHLEDPVDGLTTDENTLKIRGWALNGSGVKEVKLYVDNAYVGSAKIGQVRPDVNNAFPGYPDGAKSGFAGEINIGKFSAGEKSIKAEVIGNDGSIDSQTVKIHLNKKPSKMHLEDPADGLTIDGNRLKVRGWALNGSGVKEIKIYVDNTYVGNAKTGQARPDVNNAFPGYLGGDRSGFTGEFDISKFAIGEKAVKAEVIGNDGSVDSQTAKITLKRKQAEMNLEDPSNGLLVEGNTLNVRGWALNGFGVKEIKIYVDNIYVGNAKIGQSRPDVNNAFPGYPGGDKSGFTGVFDITKIIPGEKVIKAEVVGNDGSTKIQTSKITLKKKSAKMHLEDPANGLTVEDNTLNVRGWALNGSGVKEIKIYVDNTYVGNAKTGLARPDVNNAFPGYPGGDKSGFNGVFDITRIAPGNRNVKIEVIGVDGSIDTLSAMIHLKKKASKVNLEDPSEGAVIEGNTLNVRGWALNGSGIKEVQMFVDDRYIGNANIRVERPDVNNVFPGYPGGHNSGFNGEINVKDVSKGIHKISVKTIGNDNTYEETSKWVSIQNKNNVINQVEIIDPHLEFNFGDEGPLPNNPEALVLHHAEASNASVYDIHRWHKDDNGWAGIGYHFYIRKDGKIYKGREENWRGAHAPDYNGNSLGICAEGAYDRENMPQVQKDAIIKLGKYLVAKYGIHEVFKHGQVTATDCPGKKYPFDEIKKAILDWHV